MASGITVIQSIKCAERKSKRERKNEEGTVIMIIKSSRGDAKERGGEREIEVEIKMRVFVYLYH